MHMTRRMREIAPHFRSVAASRWRH